MAIERYQAANDLAVTGNAGAATVSLLKDQLAAIENHKAGSARNFGQFTRGPARP